MLRFPYLPNGMKRVSQKERDRCGEKHPDGYSQIWSSSVKTVGRNSSPHRSISVISRHIYRFISICIYDGSISSLYVRIVNYHISYMMVINLPITFRLVRFIEITKIKLIYK
jgi:hypothetical protein